MTNIEIARQKVYEINRYITVDLPEKYTYGYTGELPNVNNPDINTCKLWVEDFAGLYLDTMLYSKPFINGQYMYDTRKRQVYVIHRVIHNDIPQKRIINKYGKRGDYWLPNTIQSILAYKYWKYLVDSGYTWKKQEQELEKEVEQYRKEQRFDYWFKLAKFHKV